MRPRAVGGYEPDEAEQRELVGLWHLSATAVLSGLNFGIVRSARIDWVVQTFLREHATEPNVARKWVYCWCVENLGVHVPLTGGLPCCDPETDLGPGVARAPRRRRAWRSAR